MSARSLNFPPVSRTATPIMPSFSCFLGSDNSEITESKAVAASSSFFVSATSICITAFNFFTSSTVSPIVEYEDKTAFPVFASF